MSRTRLVYHAFFTDEDLSELPALTRLAAIALLTVADREGRLEYRPRRLKVEILPYDDGADIGSIVEQLQGAKWLDVYTVDGRDIIQIRNFVRFQRIHPREKPSLLPAKGEPKVIPRRTQGKPKVDIQGNTRLAQGEPICPASASASTSTSTSASASASRSAAPKLSTGGDEKAILEKGSSQRLNPDAKADAMAKLAALAEKMTARGGSH